MFETRKHITVKDVSFDMILVEGGKFCIGNKEMELEDFYMAEIPVTQELYMAVMGPAHTGSHNMMPDNFDYLDPNRYLMGYNVLRRDETTEEYRKRLDREWREKTDREDKERDRIRKLAASLPVNNISWLDCIEFINKLNSLTGLNFALPSFEQWYFAASGGIASRGYRFAGSNDANEVGHFNKLSKEAPVQGIYIMTGVRKKTSKRKPATCWFEKPKHYRPNELGIYDMSGLVYEWLDTPDKIIGGEFDTDPETVTRNRNYGYTNYSLAFGFRSQVNSCVYHSGNSNPKEGICPHELIGLRLILAKQKKQYAIPQEPRICSIVTESERKMINIISSNPELGAIRNVIADKFVKEPTIRCREERFGFSRFNGNVYRVFVCPQNINGFDGHCFENYFSRRAFISHCKQLFVDFLGSLIEQGFDLLINDELGLNLSDDSRFSAVRYDFTEYKFRGRDNDLSKSLSGNEFFTNNSTAIKVEPLQSLFGGWNGKDYNIIQSSDLIFIDVLDTVIVKRHKDISEEVLFSIGNSVKPKKRALRLSLSCFCDFNGGENDFAGVYYGDFQSKGIVRFMREALVNNHLRINDEDFDNSIRVNRLFCKRSKGGLYQYDYPEPSGMFAIQDERFYILPQMVYDEWRQSLKRLKQ